MSNQSNIDYLELLEDTPSQRQESVTISIQVTPGKLFFFGVTIGVLVMAIPFAFLVSKSEAATVTAPRAEDVIVRAATAPPSGACGSGGGGCGGCGGGARPAVEPQIGTVQNKQTTNGANVQVLKSVYTYDKDMVPNTFSVKKGVLVKLELDVREDGQGCMSTITIPELYDQVEPLTAGQKIIMEFTPFQTGEYPITCAMGIPRGTVKVID